MMTPVFTTEDLTAMEGLPDFGAQNRGELPAVLIYTPKLLSTVQHYVREHAVRLRRYRPILAGRRRVEGTPFDDIPHFTFPLGFRGRLREFRFVLTGENKELATFITRHGIRLVHAHFGPGGTEIMPLADRLGIPLIVTFHGWDVKLGPETRGRVSAYERLYRRRLPLLFKQASKVICVSRNWADRVIALGCPPEKVQTNYLGVDSSFFDGAREGFDPMSLLFVGRLVRRKGVHVLIEAIRLLRERFPNVYLTVVGEGPEQSTLETMAKQRNLPVQFLGKKSSREIRTILRQSAVLCVPSTTAEGEVPEALGLVLLEAQAMRVPVVASRNGGIPEAVEDGKTGLLVDEDSPAALAEALGKLISDVAVNRSFGESARTLVCERFDIERCYEGLETIYDGVLHPGTFGKQQCALKHPELTLTNA